jgi:hypothetical protein
MVRKLEKIYLDDLAASAGPAAITPAAGGQEGTAAPAYYQSEIEAAEHGLSADSFVASCLGTRIRIRELRDVSAAPWPRRLALRACGFCPSLQVGDSLQAYRLHHTSQETGFEAWQNTSRGMGLGSDEDGRNWLIHPMPGVQRHGHYVQLADSHFVLLAK